MGCNIIARGPGGLHIKSDKDINIEAAGSFNVTAREIKMKTTGDTDGDFTVHANRDIMLDAANNFKTFGTKCIISATETMVTHSNGWNFIMGNPVYVYEKKSKLIPSGIKSFVEDFSKQFTL
jgi:hypothetical protein